jgi:glycosyltransferase involved in cell wall biosynthesis
LLVIITTHPIQYQVPLWQALASDGQVPFEVWYLTHHGVTTSLDTEFGKSFAWDIDMLAGYPHRLLTVARGATPATFGKCRLVEPIAPMLRESGVRAVWVQGWQVFAYWQAVWAAKYEGCEVWLRAESNDLAPVPQWKRPAKRLALGMLFRRIDRFLYIGSANRRLYEKFGISEARLAAGPYAIDIDRFAAQAAALRPRRNELRSKWGVADDAYCVMFCGKFIKKKRPLDLVEAARVATSQVPKLHLLFAGSGELGGELRSACNVAFDAEAASTRNVPPLRDDGANDHPRASFVGFLNQTEISQAYVAADCLVLPSDYGETWGLVVNEAMASGLPCIISDHCGCAEDLGTIHPNSVFGCGDIFKLGHHISKMAMHRQGTAITADYQDTFTFSRSVESVIKAYRGLNDK